MVIPLSRRSKSTLKDIADFIIQMFEDSYECEKIKGKIYKAIELNDIVERINNEGYFGNMVCNSSPIRVNSIQVGYIIKKYLKDKVIKLETKRDKKYKYFVCLIEDTEPTECCSHTD